MKINLTSFLLSIFFILITAYGKCQNLVRPGFFTYNGATFKAELSTRNKDELLIEPQNSPNLGENPKKIEGLDTNEVLSTLEVQNLYDYNALLPLFSNYATLKKDGEYIRIIFSINGDGVINKMIFYIYGQTKISQQDIGKFYQKIIVENKFRLTSKDDKHRPLKYIFRTKTIKFNTNYHVSRTRNN